MRGLGRLAGALACAFALLAAPATAAEVDRLYLLGTAGGTAYYGPDADDPEAPAGSLHQRCNVFLNPSPTRLCQQTFMPAVALEEPLTWSPAQPLRFHAELAVDSVADRTVTFFVQSGLTQYETPAAREVSPGVWEAALTGPGEAAAGKLTQLGVRVRATGATVAMTLRTRGRSWVDLGAPARGHSSADLERATPRPAAPQVHQTGQRRFSFADGDWSAHEFSGTLDAERTFSVSLGRRASAVYAWVEHADGPLLHAASRGSAPDPRWRTDVPSLTLLRDGQAIGDGGSQSRAARDVPAGALQVRVGRSPAARDKPYTVHVVAVHGERTLRAMRWRTAGADSAQAGPASACGHTFDPLVVSDKASTFTVGLTWSSANPTASYALAYDLPTVGSVVCGNEATDPQIRFVFPRASRLLLFEPRITTRQPNASVADTVFEFEARIAYTPVEASARTRRRR